MRGRIVFIVVAAIVAAAIAALNWPEFTRAETLSFGVVTATTSVGIVMLALLAIVLLVFLVSSAIQESRYLVEYRRQSRSLQAQRELAEKAEASRFTELRQQLDTHVREGRQQEQIVMTELEKRMMNSHNDLRAQVERMHQLIAARLAEIEQRVIAVQSAPRPQPAPGVPPHQHVPL